MSEIRVNSDSWTGRDPSRAARKDLPSTLRMRLGAFGLIAGGIFLGLGSSNFSGGGEIMAVVSMLGAGVAIIATGAHHVRLAVELKAAEMAAKGPRDARR